MVEGETRAGYDSFLEPKKESKKAACDVKVNWIKIERDHWPHAGQGKFCVPGSAQAPSVPLNISPWTCCARPALICDQRATGRNWVREADLADCDSWGRTSKFLAKRKTIKAFSLRRRWAALAARMRCSRRSGVILELVIITAISWTMVLSIRHSRFAALTLAKLVASLALHPPVSATGSGGLRASPPPTAEPLLKEKPFGGRSI